MSSHVADDQISGYVYQIDYALFVLLSRGKDSECSKVALEKLDDICYESEEDLNSLIQTKHHQNHKNLSECSEDLWRTINSWIDVVKDNNNLINFYDFIIVTTAKIPSDSSLLSSFRFENKIRNVDSIYISLQNICKTSNNQKNKRYYEAFLNTNERIIKSIISRMYIIDDENDIRGIGEKIKKEHLVLTCLPQNINQVYEKIIMWWRNRVIDTFSKKGDEKYITFDEVRAKIVSINQEFSATRLPIDPKYSEDKAENLIVDKTQTFIFGKQLKLIDILEGTPTYTQAKKDYLCAFYHRSWWTRNNDLLPGELEEYDYKLIDAWERDFYQMEETLRRKGSLKIESEKIQAGYELYCGMKDKPIYIREEKKDLFIIMGSYHILSSQLKVGWHIDYESILGSEKNEKVE